MDCSTPGFPVHHQLPEFAHTHIHRVGEANHLILLSPFPPVFKLSQHQCLLATICTIWPLYSGQIIGASTSVSVLSMNIHDWFPLGLDLLAVQGTLKSLFQHHSSKASSLQCSAFFMGQLLHPYMSTGKKYSFDYMDLCWFKVLEQFGG